MCYSYGENKNRKQLVSAAVLIDIIKCDENTVYTYFSSLHLAREAVG